MKNQVNAIASKWLRPMAAALLITSIAGFISWLTPAAAVADDKFKWNRAERERPLLQIAGESVNADEVMKVRFPMGDRFFPIFDVLHFDVERGSFWLGEVGEEHVEFAPTDGGRNYLEVKGNLVLRNNEGQKIIETSEGERFLFLEFPDGEFRCAFIKDNQGRGISFTYFASGMMLHSVNDSFGRTVTFDYAEGRISAVTENWMQAQEGITKRWVVRYDDGSADGLVKFSHASSDKAVPTNAISREYTPEMAASDRLLAQVFGGPGCVAAGNGFEPAGLMRSYAFYRGDTVGDDGELRRGHLSWAMHVYGSADGLAQGALYVPEGFTEHSDRPSPNDAVVTFYYPRLGNYSDVTLAVFHVANFETVKEGLRVRIGKIGGPGGASRFYVHSHIEFYRGNTGLPKPSDRARLRIDPATVFTEAKEK